MYPRLAAQIHQQLPALLDRYDAQLRIVPGYAALPEPDRRGLEQQVLQLMADCLQIGDDAALIQYVNERAEQVLARGFQPEWFQQAVTVAEETITPLILTVDEGNFVWRAMNRAQTAAWQIVARERQRIESTLRESEARYQTIFDSTPIMFWLKDTHNRTLRINRAAAEFEGVKPADVEGISAYDLYPHEQAEAFYQDDLAVISSNQPKLGIIEQHTSVGTGKPMWVETGKTPVHNDQGEVIGVLAFGVDITERKQAEEALRTSEEQYRRAITAAGAVPYYIDYATERYRFIGEAIGKLTGYPAEEITPTLLGQLIQETIMTGQGSALSRETAIHEARAGALTSWNADYRLIDRAGQTHWLNDSSIQILDETGKAIGAIGILQDITPRKATEESLQRSAEQQERAARYLRATIEATNELTEVQDLDTLYRRTVELAREKFDVERCGLFLLDEGGQSMLGTFGTDDQLRTTDERGIQRPASEFEDVLSSQQGHYWVVRETDHVYIEDGVRHIVGVGWVANTILRGVAGPIGILFNDRALSGQPVDNAQQEALAVYCSAAGSIIERKRIEEQVRQSLARRGVQVQTSTEVAQEIASATDLNELFRRVVTLIKERFNYYHAQIFRYDPAQEAVVLITGYGEIGQQMLLAGHKLQMGRGVVGTAATTGQSILAADVREDADWRPNPYLPDTRGELAVPITWRDQVLGILDVQSDRVNALSDDDRLLLEGLCGQIAIAIESTRLLESVQRSELDLRKFKLGLDRSTAAIFITDINGVITYANPAFEKIYGYPREEAIGQTPRLLKSGLMPQEQYQRFWGSLLAGQTVTGEIVNKAKDGRLVPIQGSNSAILDDSGKIIGFLALHNDISERKQAEQELSRFKQGLEQASDAVFMTDVDGRITYVNPAFERIYGYSRKEVLGQTPRILKSGQLSQEFYKGFWQTLLNKQSISGEKPNKTKDGRVIVIEDSNSPILDSAGNLLGFLSSHRDITERKRAEQQVEETLRETERLYAAVSAEGWKSFRESSHLPDGYLYDRTLLKPAEDIWEPEIERAAIEERTVATQTAGRAVAVAPMAVRGTVIGALGVYDDPAHPLPPEDVALIEAVSEQVALALESARLFEQTQRDAERERAINRITGRIRSARSVEEVLAVATQELRLATQASRSVVEIAPRTAKPAAAGNGGQPRS